MREWLILPNSTSSPLLQARSKFLRLGGKQQMGKRGGGVLIHPLGRVPEPCCFGQIPGEEEDRCPLDNLGYLRKREQSPCPRGAHRSQNPEFPRACVVRFVRQSDPYPVAWEQQRDPRWPWRAQKCNLPRQVYRHRDEHPPCRAHPTLTTAWGGRQSQDLYWLPEETQALN